VQDKKERVGVNDNGSMLVLNP